MSDVVVLGGGAAGSVLAARLSEDAGRMVTLVEAGPDYGPPDSGRWPAEMLDARAIPDSHDWRDDQGTLAIARVIGGCSAHNLCFWIHPPDADYDEWAQLTGDDGWSAAGMRRFVARVERVMPRRHDTGADLSPWLQSCRAAADATGLGAVPDINDHRHPEGLGPMPLNARGTTRFNAAFAYLDAARARPNLTVLGDTLVSRLELDGPRVRAAVVRRGGAELRLDADTFVVAGGSYGSPAILMRSGIGPQAELRRHGIPVRLDLPVGEHLRDHLQTRIRVMPTAGLERRLAEHRDRGLGFACQGLARAISSQSEDGIFDAHLLVIAAPAEGGFVIGLNAALLKPRWTGTVRLRSADPEHLPVVTAQDVSDPADATALAGTVERCHALLEAVRGEWTGPVTADGAVAPYYHPVGTCAMGVPGDRVSVTDAAGRVHGVENLHVADASLMPSVPRANTHLPTLAVAERIAALLRGETRQARHAVTIQLEDGPRTRPSSPA